MSMRTLQTLAACLVAALVAPAHAEWTTVDDAWYAMTLAGQPCGHLRVASMRDGEVWRTVSETTMRMGRAGAAVEIAMASSFDERADHTPIAASYTQAMGGAPVTTEWSFTATDIEVTSAQGGRRMTERKPLPTTPWLTPLAVDALRKEAFAKGLDSVEYATLDPQSGTSLMTVTSRKTGAGKQSIQGVERDVIIWTTRTSMMPIDTVESYDPKGEMLRQVTAMALGTIEALRTTKEAALAGGKGAAAPELLTSSFLQLDPNVPGLDCAPIVVWDLRTKDGAPLDLPDAGGQATVRTERGERVTVSAKGSSVAPTGDGLKEFLASSPMCDLSDARLKSLTKRALKGKEDASEAERAEALRAFVLRYIDHKDLGTAFATASDTAKSKSGDCSEHATLLTALLRCAGVPSRAATGLVYADSFAGGKHVMGWHMWTQAVIDGKWVDLDATRPDCAFDGGHILTATTSLSEGSLGTDLGSVVLLLGNLAVDDVRVNAEP